MKFLEEIKIDLMAICAISAGALFVSCLGIIFGLFSWGDAQSIMLALMVFLLILIPCI